MESICKNSITSLTLTDIKKVSEQAASDGLMANDKNVFLSFQLHYHRFQSHHQVLVRLQQ